MTDDGSRTFDEEELRSLRHDVRSPLMVISGFARMLLSGTVLSLCLRTARKTYSSASTP